METPFLFSTMFLKSALFHVVFDFLNDFRRDTAHNAVVRRVFRYDRSGGYYHVIANRHAGKNRTVSALRVSDVPRTRETRPGKRVLGFGGVERLARFDFAGSLDRLNLAKLVGVRDKHRRERLVLPFNGVKVKLHEQIALAHFVAVLDDGLEVLPFQFDGLQTHVNEHFRAGIGENADGVLGIENGVNLAVHGAVERP